MPPPSRDRVRDAVRHRFDAIVSLIDGVCRAHLTEEYAVLARELATTLARKRPSPLVNGRVATWACGITYVLGMVNFLFDQEQTPHLRGNDLCALFGVSQSAGSAKAREIMRLLRIVQLDPRWCLPSKLAENPLAWMIEVNGIVVDVRMMPRELQEEAHRLGLIPFVPD
jgi:hypothetical protein